MGTILLVDDDPKILKMLTRRLKKAGHEIHSAENGKAGIEKIASGLTPGMILMDMNMPVMGGDEATRTLRRNGYEGLIVALSASVTARDSGRALQAGCNCFIPKPVEADFEERIRQLLAAGGA